MLVLEMIKWVYSFFIIYLLANSTFVVHTKEIYEVEADELMDTMLKNVHKGKFQLSVPTYKSTTKIPTSDMTETIVVTKNASSKIYTQNLTLEELHLRKTKLDIKTLLDSSVSLPNFDNEDEISKQTRRFHNIQNSNETNLRDHYTPNSIRSGDTVYHRKNRTIQLMAQFVYQIRYQLPYVQLLRKKYSKNLRYRIGYCFALLRNLKRQQMVIFTTMKNYQQRFLVLYAIIKLYEKVVKLNVDVKDLIKYILHLDGVRQKAVDAKFTKKIKE